MHNPQDITGTVRNMSSMRNKKLQNSNSNASFNPFNVHSYQTNYHQKKRGHNIAAGMGTMVLVEEREIQNLEEHLDQNELKSLHSKFPNLSRANLNLIATKNKTNRNSPQASFIDKNIGNVMRQSNYNTAQLEPLSRHYSPKSSSK